MTEDKPDQVEWNMANLLNIELSRLRSEANVAFITGNFRKAIDSVVSMRMTASHVIGKEEHAQLEVIEREMFPLVIGIGGMSSFNNEARQKAVECLFPLRQKYIRYNRLLMSLLDKYGFLGGRKKDATSMNFGGNTNDD